MSNWNLLNQGRVRQGTFASEDCDGFNGAFCIWIESKRVKIIASDGEGWRHVSVSLHDEPRRTPSWSIMCRVKELFWDEDDWVVQFHPARSEYVNNHPGCLHLWQPTDEKLPTPPSIMVGIK